MNCGANDLSGTADVAISGHRLSKVYGIGRRQAQAALASEDALGQVARLGGVLAVHDVSFRVQRGEMFVIMGLSGSGKSTLLRMINRLNDISAGVLEIDGEDISSMSDARLRELRNNKLGMVFQHFSLFPHRTIRENAAYGLKVRGMSRRARLELAEHALARVGLGGKGDKLPHELSGGMKQRVGLARALATDPPILLMDEPFSALDPLIKRDMQDLLLTLQENDRRTTIFVTHDLNEAMRLGDRVMVMRDGNVVQVGAGAEIVAAPADDYVSEFVADVDRTRILTAGDLLRPALLTFRVQESPSAALRRLGDIEANGAFVVDDDRCLLGIVTDQDLSVAVRRNLTDLSSVLTQNYQPVRETDRVADIMHMAGRHPVPLTVVDSTGRLAGVVPRAVILSALSNAREDVHA